MKQSTVIAATLVAAFVLFITARGRLSAYVSVLWGPSQSVPTPTGGGSGSLTSIAEQTPSGGNPLMDVGKTVMEILPFIGG